MLSPFQGGLPRKPLSVSRIAAGLARIAYRAGKPADVPADGPLRAERAGAGMVRVIWPTGAPDLVPVDGIAGAAAARPDPGHVSVLLTDGNTVTAPLAGGSAWRLTDAGVSLADPTLRLDGTVAP